MSEIQRVVDLIRRGQRFLLTCHVLPDPDAVGSMLGLAEVLRHIGKEVVLYNRDPIPPNLRFLAGSSEVLHKVPPGEHFDGMLITDTAARSLLPTTLPPQSVTGPLVVLDHHVAHDDFGDVVVRNVDACATAEVVLDVMRELGIHRVPEAAAEPLYAAIIADTGGFRHPGTSAQTLRLGAELLDAGVDPWHVAHHVFESWPLPRLRLLSMVIDGLQTDCGGKLAMLQATRAMLETVGASEDMVDGLVEYGRRLAGVEVAAMLWERRPRADETAVGDVLTKVSLRSAGRIDVADIATQLGGGGHRAAAGATLRAKLPVARTHVLAAVKHALRELKT